MPTVKALDGNAAVAEAVRLARVQVIAAYPITPQTPIVEHLATAVESGRLPARYIPVESEHSALSAVAGASLVGARAFTATAGAGLALMHEIVGVVAGTRLPVVMAVTNRALPSPWTLQTDHSDTMAERDQGWIQLYAESAQEALDLILVGYRTGEDPRVLLPVMVALDGFFVSHTVERVEVPDPEQVDAYLPPPPTNRPLLDPDHPVTINQLTSPDIFTEIKWQHREALQRALGVLAEAGEAYGRHFGRRYAPVEPYLPDTSAAEGWPPDVAIVTMGSMAGTVRQALRDGLLGEFAAPGGRPGPARVGLVKVTCFRPFPAEALRELLAGVQAVAVVDRSAGLGSQAPLAMEVKAALYDLAAQGRRVPLVQGFVAGLGGRDFTVETLRRVVETTLGQLANTRAGGSGLAAGPGPTTSWPDLKLVAAQPARP